MKWLIYLYPKKWRIRYEDEFLYILENRNLSIKDIIDVFINAVDARFLNLAEGMISMDNKVRDIMLKSFFKRLLILGLVILVGMFGGYWIANNTPSVLALSPKIILLIGVGMGLFAGYVVGLARGIMRVIKVTKEKDVFLPNGKLKFDKVKG